MPSAGGPLNPRRASDTGRRIGAAVLGVVAACGIAAAAATTRVTYLAGGTVYVEAGKLEGLREGDTLRVIRDGVGIAGLRVTYLSSHRASCDTFAVVQAPRVGDDVRFEPHAPLPVARAGADSSGAAAASGDSPAAATAAVDTTRSRRGPRPYRGRVGLRYLSIQSSNGAGSVRQPALDLRFDGTGIAGILDLAADARSRRTSWIRSDGSVQNDGQARVYRLALGLHDEAGRYRITLGRQTSPALAAVSLFDGALLESAGQRWSAGLFSGTQPEPADLGLSTDILEYGGFAGLHSPPRATRRWRMDLGAVSSYAGGQPNRDFAFAQASLQDPRLSLSGTQEVDFNRGWKIALGEPSWSATSTFLLARVQVVEPFAVRGGFDNRRNVRLYRDRLTPETDFDDRYRQGAWGGASLELIRHLRFDGDYRVRGGADASHTWSGSMEAFRLGPVHALVRGRYSIYRSDPTESQLLTLSFGLDPIPGTHVETSGGTRTTTDRASGIEERIEWQSVDFDLALARRWYVNGSYERDQGGVDRTTQAYTGLSWRF